MEEEVDIAFLMETKLSEREMVNAWQNLENYEGVYVDSVGRGLGL